MGAESKHAAQCIAPYRVSPVLAEQGNARCAVALRRALLRCPRGQQVSTLSTRQIPAAR
jgi:hypothetical protein